MATNTSRSAGFGALLTAMIAAVQWRLLLLWLLIMLIPATVVALPLAHTLGDLLNHSVHADEWAEHFNDLMFSDVAANLYNHVGWFGATAILGLVATLLLSPFINGMIIGSGRAGRALGFAALLQNGLIEYGRMFRVLLWSLVPYAVLIGIAAAGMHMADDHSDKVVLESQADTFANVIHVIALIVFVLVQCIVEAARAAFIADVTLRSATRALGRGFMQLIKRPLKTLLFYLVVTLVGGVLVMIFGMARIHVTAYGLFGFLFALLLSQVVVLVIGWMRTARLFALAEVARFMVPGQRAQAEYR